MPRKIEVKPGSGRITLPNGRTYNVGDDDDPVEVVLTDAEFESLDEDALDGFLLEDLGSFADPDIDAEFVTEEELAEAGFVASMTITHIEQVTQAAYDALDPPDPNTLYAIVG